MIPQTRDTLRRANDETDGLYRTDPQSLAARYGQRTIGLIRDGRDVYETARLAASFAAQALDRPKRKLAAELDAPETAIVLAEAIRLNCDLLERGEIDPTAWTQEQERLYAIAAAATCCADVLRLVCPSIGRGR